VCRTQLSEKYSVLASVDKFTAVGAKVDEVRLVMEGNINRVLDNAENLSNVEDKAGPFDSVVRTDLGNIRKDI
jgi:hypothetical protein